MGPHSCACNLTTDLHPVGSVWGGTRWDWSGTFPVPLSWRSSTPSLCTWTQPQDSRGKGQSSPWGPPDRSGWCLQGASSYSCWGLPPTRKMYPFYFSKQPFSILYNEVMCFFLLYSGVISLWTDLFTSFFLLFFGCCSISFHVFLLLIHISSLVLPARVQERLCKWNKV